MTIPMWVLGLAWRKLTTLVMCSSTNGQVSYSIGGEQGQK